jgi:hypothetical protein
MIHLRVAKPTGRVIASGALSCSTAITQSDRIVPSVGFEPTLSVV